MQFYNPFFYNILPRPFLPPDYDIPPTVYAILNSYVNFGKTEKTKIPDLAKEGRNVFFDFDYDITDKISKEELETMILNHYMMSRIGFDTVTAFKLNLSVKMKSIMPLANKLFDAIDELNIFEEDITTIDSTDNRDISDAGTTTSNSSNINDNRFSDEPQNQLTDVQDGSYITNYTYNTDTSNNTINENLTRDDDNVHHEVQTRKKPDNIDAIIKYQNEINSVYDFIFKELDSLFYGLV